MLTFGLIAFLVARPIISCLCLVGLAGGVLAIVAMIRAPHVRTPGNIALAILGVGGAFYGAWWLLT